MSTRPLLADESDEQPDPAPYWLHLLLWTLLVVLGGWMLAEPLKFVSAVLATILAPSRSIFIFYECPVFAQQILPIWLFFSICLVVWAVGVFRIHLRMVVVDPARQDLWTNQAALVACYGGLCLLSAYFVWFHSYQLGLADTLSAAADWLLKMMTICGMVANGLLAAALARRGATHVNRAESWRESLRLVLLAPPLLLIGNWLLFYSYQAGIRFFQCDGIFILVN